MASNRGEETNKYIRKYLRKGIISLLFCVIMASFLVFSLPQVSHATENVISDTTPTDPTVDRDSHLTGTSDERTNINAPGRAETHT